MKKPKTLPFKRINGAPPYVHAVHKAPGPGMENVFMVFFTWPLWEPAMGRRQPYLEVEVGRFITKRSWGEISDRTDRQGCGTLVSWSDVPSAVKNAVVAAVNYPDELVIVSPSWETNCEGRLAYLLGMAHGFGYVGSPLGYSSIKACREVCTANGWLFLEHPECHALFLKEHRAWKHRELGLA